MTQKESSAETRGAQSECDICVEVTDATKVCLNVIRMAGPLQEIRVALTPAKLNVP